MYNMGNFNQENREKATLIGAGAGLGTGLGLSAVANKKVDEVDNAAQSFLDEDRGVVQNRALKKPLNNLQNLKDNVNLKGKKKLITAGLTVPLTYIGGATGLGANYLNDKKNKNASSS